MFKFHDVEQNTDDWFLLRAGKLTSSNMGKVMANSTEYSVLSISKAEGFAIANNKTKSVLKPRYETKVDAESALAEIKKKDLKKAFGDLAKKYAVSIAIEQITGTPIESSYTNDDMERGHEQEPIARMLYEEQNFCDVTNGGFFESDFVGCSPDGMVGDDGVIEIKSVIGSVHYANVKRQSFDPSYKWQLIGNLYFTGRDWMDFVSYSADFPEGKRLYTFRLNAADYQEEFKMIDERIALFEKLVSEIKQDILEKQYTIQG